MEMSMQTMNDLFLDALKDIYYAEKQITKALPKMAKKASSPKLKQAFEKHLAETEGQIERLEEIFQMLDVKPAGKKCPGILGILEEGSEVMEEAEDKDVRDAAMIAAAQAVEHYEITRYGSLAAWAEQLGMREAKDLLGQTLDEEKATDEALTELATADVNVKAA
jgi:ferritin-like metal-binding protein YciE